MQSENLVRREEEDVGPGQANRAAEEVRALEGVRSQGSLPQGHGDPRRREQRSTSRRTSHCKSQPSYFLWIVFVTFLGLFCLGISCDLACFDSCVEESI